MFINLCILVIAYLDIYVNTILPQLVFQKHPYVVLGNIGLGLMSVFHLAYLGLMFDSSEQEEQVRMKCTS